MNSWKEFPQITILYVLVENLDIRNQNKVTKTKKEDVEKEDVEKEDFFFWSTPTKSGQ